MIPYVTQKYIGTPYFEGVPLYHTHPTLEHPEQVHIFIVPDTSRPIKILYYENYPDIPTPRVIPVVHIEALGAACMYNFIPISVQEQVEVKKNYYEIMRTFIGSVKINKVMEV